MQKKILVTGGLGFIGSNFVIESVKRGFHPVILDKKTYAASENNLKDVKEQDYTLYIGDIGDYNLVKEILNKHEIELIINFAAESHVDNSIAEPAAFINTNIMGTYQLLQASLHYYQELTIKENFRFIHISTDEVFGTLSLDNLDEKFNELSPINPSSPYSASKAASDHLAHAWYKTYGLPTIITHCTNNYGPRQHPEKLIPFMIKQALNSKPLTIYGSGENIRDWLHVDDHVNGIFLVIEKGLLGEAYNFGGNNQLTNNYVVNKICTILDKLRPAVKKYCELITYVKDRPGHDLRYAIDGSKAEKSLGFKLNYDFDKGLEETITWYLERDKL